MHDLFLAVEHLRRDHGDRYGCAGERLRDEEHALSETYRWRRGDGDQSPSIGDLARGAVGVARAALGRDRAPEDAITARWDSCLACEKHDRGVCLACGCFVGAKIRLASSACPEARWVAVTVAGAEPTKRGCGCGKRTLPP